MNQGLIIKNPSIHWGTSQDSLEQIRQDDRLLFSPIQHISSRNSLIDSCILLVYNNCNYTGKARIICRCQFPHRGFFDLFRLNEALDNLLTNTNADRDTLLQIYGKTVGLAKGQCKNPWVVYSQDYYRIYYGTAV